MLSLSAKSFMHLSPRWLPLRDSLESKVPHYWKSLVQSDNLPNNITVTIDGMFLIISTRRCSTYSLFAQAILKITLKQTSHRADICFQNAIIKHCVR